MGNLFDGVNFLHVLVAALAYWALGSIWYSKILFSAKWVELANININDPNATKGMGLMFSGSFVLMFIISLVIAILANRMGVGTCMGGIKLGLIVGIGFSATSIGINYLYEKKPMVLFLINAGYQVLGSIIAGVIICCWH